MTGEKVDLEALESKAVACRAGRLTTRITYLVVFGGEENMDLATLLTDYVVHHLDGQEMYDLGGEGG